MYHLSDAVRVRTFRGLQSVDCRKLRVFRRTGTVAQCGRHYGKCVAGTRGISVVL